MKKELGFTFRQVNIKVSILIFVMFPAMLLAGRFEKFILAFVSIMLHELGHISAACMLKIKVYTVTIMPVGLNAVIEDGAPGIWRQLIIYSSGPFANILVSAAALIISIYLVPESECIALFALINIYLAVFNLLPVMPLDGGKILKTIIANRVGFLHAGRYTKRITLTFAVFITVLGIVQLYVSRYNFSIFIVSIYILFSLKWDETEAALMNVKSIIYRRSRLLKKGVYQARELVVLKTVMLSEIIKNMDYDRFHIIYVLDDDLKLVKAFTEQEIIDAFFDNKADITFEELVKKSEANMQG